MATKYLTPSYNHSLFQLFQAIMYRTHVGGGGGDKAELVQWLNYELDGQGIVICPFQSKQIGSGAYAASYSVGNEDSIPEYKSAIMWILTL